MATMASTEDCEFLVATDLEAPDTSAASVQPDSGTPAEPRVIPALVVGFMAMALMAASLLLLDLEEEHQGKARWRLLQAAGGGSAVGSCWLKCGAAVGKAVHWIGTFIARTFASVGRCIHSIFASVNSGFGDCCGAVGHQLGRCPGCGGWCSHCWMASGRCMGGCCMSVGNLINGILMVLGSSISSCCEVLTTFFQSSWSTCGHFLNETCPF